MWPRHKKDQKDEFVKILDVMGCMKRASKKTSLAKNEPLVTNRGLG